MKRGYWLLVSIWLLPLMAGVAQPWITAHEPQPHQSDLKAKVQALVDQMEQGTTDGKRSAAEWELLKLGPEALPFLPGANKDQLAAVRFTLAEMRPRTWTQPGGDMPLATALDQLA